MYLFRIKPLVKDLCENRVGKDEKFKYLMFNSLLIYIEVMMPQTDVSKYHLYNSLVYVLIMLIGYIAIFDINKRNDNKDFIERLICLECPLVVRTFFLYFIVGIIEGTIVKQYVPDIDRQGLISLLLNNAVNIYYYTKLYFCVAEISSYRKKLFQESTYLRESYNG
jgi:hypothetical protein